MAWFSNLGFPAFWGQAPNVALHVEVVNRDQPNVAENPNEPGQPDRNAIPTANAHLVEEFRNLRHLFEVERQENREQLDAIDAERARTIELLGLLATQHRREQDEDRLRLRRFSTEVGTLEERLSELQATRTREMAAMAAWTTREARIRRLFQNWSNRDDQVDPNDPNRRKVIEMLARVFSLDYSADRDPCFRVARQLADIYRSANPMVNELQRHAEEAVRDWVPRYRNNTGLFHALEALIWMSKDVEQLFQRAVQETRPLSNEEVEQVRSQLADYSIVWDTVPHLKVEMRIYQLRIMKGIHAVPENRQHQQHRALRTVIDTIYHRQRQMAESPQKNELGVILNNSFGRTWRN